MSKYILSIDQGTTGTTVALVNRAGQIEKKINHEIPQHYPRPGWVEHDPEEIWASVLRGVAELLGPHGGRSDSIAAIGITNQRETAVLWNRQTAAPAHAAIVWQCRRTSDFCASLKKRGLEKKIVKRTGLVLDPYFSASKFRWLLREAPLAKKWRTEGQLCAGTIDSYLLFRLTGGRSHKTDVSNASRTQLMDIATGRWDPELLELFDVPVAILPEISPSSGTLGLTRGVPGLPDGIPIAGMAGDQQAALFGQFCIEAGTAKCTYGTGSFILLNTGQKPVWSKNGLLTTVAWQLGPRLPMTYALEGGAFICGAAVQWLRDELGIIRSSQEIETLAAQVTDAGGVEFVPALTGLGAPYWDPEARGMILGLTRGSGRAHLARATLEAMALQNVDVLLAMQKDSGKKLKALRVDGGATANNLLMQLQADYLGCKIDRPKVIETTVYGAALLAGLGAGVWADLKELRQIWQVEKSFSPTISRLKRTRRLGSWHQAVERARGPGPIRGKRRAP